MTAITLEPSGRQVRIWLMEQARRTNRGLRPPVAKRFGAGQELPAAGI
jgi:hypothetical protein